MGPVYGLEPEFWGKTFDDFLVRQQYGVVKSRKDVVDLSMPLSKHIILKGLPIVAANMDTVTGSKMAKASSEEGFIGFIHRNDSTIDIQADKVRKVKRSRSYVISYPLVIHQKATIGEAKTLTKKNKINGLLVEEQPGNRILVGILSRRDIPAGEDFNSRFVYEFMTADDGHKLTTRSRDVSMEEAEKVMFESGFEKLPLIDENNQITGLITMRDINLVKQKPYANLDSKGRLLVGATIGASRDYLERASVVIEAGADAILMDIAHGYGNVIKYAIENFKKNFPEVELVAGNVSTAEGAMFLADLGVDAVKVGVGPGRGCLTRREVGVGTPQLQAIRECFIAIRGRKIPIIADGGIKYDGDINKALIVGASTVMLGSMLAGTDEAPGRLTQDKSGKWIKEYRGMTSEEAVLRGLADVSEENIDEVLDNIQAPEGQHEPVPYKGSVAKVAKRIRDHIQSFISYAGFTNLKEAHRNISRDPLKYLNPLSLASQKESFDR